MIELASLELDHMHGQLNSNQWMDSLYRICWQNTRLYWFPGHCGIEGIEKADELAQKESEMSEERKIERIAAVKYFCLYIL